ncbi:Splicing factor 3B subunit 2 [Perkinsus chesapeaki]|uniref:Splicing factor 3B subunit 2 n=1 Tax=Perkinsus chesapeaki TaxID=330153 RepID=A0A7J6MFL9_PERCH|nr:Splicing factor 3B subunit 2 [Perkinsus chesapeaki]
MVALTAAQRAERTRVKRALKRKEARKRRREEKVDEEKHKEELTKPTSPSDETENNDDDVDIEYTVRTLPEEFKAAYEKLQPVAGEGDDAEEQNEEDQKDGGMTALQKFQEEGRRLESLGYPRTDKNGQPHWTSKQIRDASRIPLVTLKELVTRPDVVEAWDNSGSDPFFLVHIKSTRNTVPVPRHWNSKRRYMACKRGSEKPRYKLPPYIEQTGIAKIRQSILEREEERTLKSQAREKIRPKVGKLDIDYNVLHDAFFKYATPCPYLTKHGDMYYEGREYESRMVNKKPGKISEPLREALGIEEGGPPPWLFNMQRYGPPPSYPGLRVPGLNAPIPAGGDWGYHPGGWGRPPVDEFGNPLYGNWNIETDRIRGEVETNTGNDEKDFLWGEFLSEASDAGSDESDDDEVMDVEEDDTRQARKDGGGTQTPILRGGLETPLGTQTPLVNLDTSGVTSVGGITSITSGIGTPGQVDIRGGIQSVASATATPTHQLYKVLPQKNIPTQASALFPSSHVYNLAEATTPLAGTATPSGSGRTMTINPSEMEADDQTLSADFIRKQLMEHEDREKAAMAAAGYKSTEGASSMAPTPTLSTPQTAPGQAEKRQRKKHKKIKF